MTVCHTNFALLMIMYQGELTENKYKFIKVQLPMVLLSKLNDMPTVRLTVNQVKMESLIC